MPKVKELDEARAAGLPTYSTGKQCAKGHISSRYTSTRACVQCADIKAKRWHAENQTARRDVDWLHCRDGKWRPVKPGLVPLVNGLPRGVVPSRYVGLEIDADNSAEARAVRLKGYGNAIDPELAAMFLLAVS